MDKSQSSVTCLEINPSNIISDKQIQMFYVFPQIVKPSTEVEKRWNGGTGQGGPPTKE
jgi:hypothetical protein